MLYQKITTGKRVRYVEYVPARSAGLPMELTDAQALTIVGTLGAGLIMIAGQMFPAHSRNARKIKAVEDAILALYKGAGAPIAPRIIDQVVDAWNRTITDVLGEGTDERRA